jgi:hypothetical protein
MSQAVPVAAATVRIEKPHSDKSEVPIASRGGGIKSTPADEQRSTCRLEREMSQIVGLGSPDDQQPSRGTKPSRGEADASQPGGERAGVLPPTGESPVSRDGCATPTCNREPVEEDRGLGAAGIQPSCSSLPNAVNATGGRERIGAMKRIKNTRRPPRAGAVRVRAGVSRERSARCVHQRRHDSHPASGTDLHEQ